MQRRSSSSIARAGSSPRGCAAVPPRPSRGAAALFVVALFAGCGSGGGRETSVERVEGDGRILEKPGGGSFLLDTHQSGTASRMRLVDIEWGRLVDVHDVDASGRTGVEPVFRDLVVDENLVGTSGDYRVETNPVTNRTRVTVLRTRGAPDDGRGTFGDLVRRASSGLPPILPKDDDGTESLPVSVVPRNAALVLRFDDLLRDDDDVERRLDGMLAIGVGYRPTRPFRARYLFDENHGGLRAGEFHSTRVIVDLAISETEAAASPTPLKLNVVGLPASRADTGAPNASLRIATLEDATVGQFEVLRSVTGAPLAATECAPFDETASTLDVVRSFRAGNAEDVNRGFLLDVLRPSIVGAWRATVVAAAVVPPGTPGGSGTSEERFLVDLRFDTVCRSTPVPGSVLVAGSTYLEVVRSDGLDDDVVRNVELRVLAGAVPRSASTLLGGVEFQIAFDRSLLVQPACWVTPFPTPDVPPNAGLTKYASIAVRFSEPIDPTSVGALDTFRLLRGGATVVPDPRNVVIASVTRSIDLRGYILTPLLPLARAEDSDYRVELRDGATGIRDLVGNELLDTPSGIVLTLDADEPAEANSGVAMTFSSRDELPFAGADDFRGQLVWDRERRLLDARPVVYATAPADRSTGIPQTMLPFGPGVQTPLSPLGSKLQTVWRYADFGWDVLDESKFDLDVVGLSWSPANGAVLSDYYPRFEMRLAHSHFLPDEQIEPVRGAPLWPGSGLGEDEVAFADNVLQDPNAPQVVVHPEELGYRISPTDGYLNANAHPMFPFPLNRGDGPKTTYTWRDTSILRRAAPFGTGIPMGVEVDPPILVPGPPGSIAGPAQVPSYGLPLLWEVRCFPSSSGVGLNPLAVNIAVLNGSRYTFPTPNFRAYSTGGTNENGDEVLVDPSQETFPKGGFNPRSKPPGLPTARVADNTYYVGEMDYVVRVTRGHFVWIDTELQDPEFVAVVVEPDVADQPPGTNVVLDYRGALSFPGNPTAPFDAAALDMYGEFEGNRPDFLFGDRSWKNDVSALDGARFFQVRVTLLGNIESGDRPVLDALGIAFRARE